MRNSEVKVRHWKSMGKFISIGILPIIFLALVIRVFIYGELQEVRSMYHLEESDFDTSYAMFDKVLILNNYIKYEFVELEEQMKRDSQVVLDEEFLEEKNESLKDKYSFLAVIIDGRYTYFGNEERYEDISSCLLRENDNFAEDDAHYHGEQGKRYLYKKLGVYFQDGRKGSVCIVTDLNVNLPHIMFFSVGIMVLIIIICIVVIVAMWGYAYYNIFAPIQKLQLAVVRIGKGELDDEIKFNKENEFAGLYEEFETMRLSLQQTTEERNKADALSKEVIGNISHDLKTPLTAIKGYAEGILDGVANTPERMEKYIRTIHSKASDMAVLVDELSYFTKIYQREETFAFTEVNVIQYFSDCIGELALDLETREIELLYQCHVDEDTTVRLDVEKIKRVIANIVGNAVKYIHHHQGMILVNISETKDRITVMIRDNGKGIGKDEIPYIFERFYRTDRARSSKTGGSGLGLAIAKKIIDEHSGNIWAESELDKGTAVYFSLPK